MRSEMSMDPNKCGVGGGGSCDKSRLKPFSCDLEGQEREFLLGLECGTGGSFFLDCANGSRVGADFSGLAVALEGICPDGLGILLDASFGGDFLWLLVA